MSLAKTMLLTDLDYSAWANRRLLDSCSSVSSEELHRDLGYSHKSILATLWHIYEGEKFWSERLLANSLPPFAEIREADHPPPPRWETIQQDWLPVGELIREWFVKLGEQETTSELPCLLQSGRTFHFTRWQLLRHIVNHSTLHRGQVVSMLRLLGAQPPNVDLTSYYLSTEQRIFDLTRWRQ